MSDVNTGTPIRIIEPAEVKSWESYDYKAAGASTVPRGVSIRLDGSPVRQGAMVILHALLENAGTAPVTLTIFADIRYAAPSFGFSVEPAPGSGQRKPRPPGEPQPPQQAPPPPLVIELPARSAVRLTSGIVLDEYDWSPGVPRELEWSLAVWNEPKPKGRVRGP
jgi:hypothetical protein